LERQKNKEPYMGEIVTVNFRGDELYGFKQDDGVFVALKPIVSAMGINWSGQEQRVKRDPVLSEGICVMHMPSGLGGAQTTLCIKIEMLNGWLFGIDSSRIKDETARQRVVLYQRECYDVLYAHFSGKRGSPQAANDLPDGTRTFGESIRLVTEVRQTWGSQAAREIYFHEKLPVTPSMLQQPQADLFTYTAIRRDPEAA
jgi:hypothetical protein